jgi:hypothetical protein
MLYKVIGLPQVSQIVEAREIASGKARKNWMAIKIVYPLRFQVTKKLGS